MGKGDSVKRFLATALACASLALSVGSPSAARDEKPAPMRFEWRIEGPAEQCGAHCRTWISATGVITEDTARAFEAFARSNNVRGARLVLDSEGGSVLSAMALGRAIRNFDMTTTVGRTTLLPSDGNNAQRATISQTRAASRCAPSSCSPERAATCRAKRACWCIRSGSAPRASARARRSYTADELQLVQRDVGRLVRYTAEMGGSMELIETALRVPPWEPMHRLNIDELRRMKITTIDHLFEQDVPAPPVAATTPNAITTSAQGQQGQR